VVVEPVQSKPLTRRLPSPLYEMVQEGIDLKTIQWSG